MEFIFYLKKGKVQKLNLFSATYTAAKRLTG